jgi:hypothetical protein
MMTPKNLHDIMNSLELTQSDAREIEDVENNNDEEWSPLKN